MCSSSRSVLISLLTRSCKLMGTLLHLWCLRWKFLWNLDITRWAFDLPMREISWGNCFAMRVLNGYWVVIVLTILPSSEQRVWVIDIPRTSFKSLPMSGFNPSLTFTNSASSIRHPLLSTGACTIPMTGIGSLAKVLSSWAIAVVNHRAYVEFLIISVAIFSSDSLSMLHTLPESMRSPTFIFPIC